MTTGKAAALTAGFVGAFLLGVAVGPSIRDSASTGKTTAVAQPVPVIAEETQAPVAAPPRANPPRSRANAVPSNAVESRAAVALSDPRLHDRVRPLLNRGAKIDIAAAGFKSAVEFATVAHAARNTNVPFMVLKHRVVTEGRPLADAIHEVKPDIDAKAEVKRAQMAARSDVAAVGG